MALDAFYASEILRLQDKIDVKFYTDKHSTTLIGDQWVTVHGVEVRLNVLHLYVSGQHAGKSYRIQIKHPSGEIESDEVYPFNAQYTIKTRVNNAICVAKKDSERVFLQLTGSCCSTVIDEYSILSTCYELHKFDDDSGYYLHCWHRDDEWVSKPFDCNQEPTEDDIFAFIRKHEFKKIRKSKQKNGKLNPPVV